MFDSAFVLGMAITAAAGLMRGFAGVGSGMLMAPFFVFLFGPVETVATIVLMESIVTVQLLPSVRREINWRLIAPIGAAAALCMPLGSWLLVSMDSALVSQVVAWVVVSFSVLLLSGWRYGGGQHWAISVGVGSVSGVLMALTSLANPPVMIYLLSGPDRAAVNRANFTGHFGITLVALITIMSVSGLITLPSVYRAAAFLPVFMLCTWIGSRLFRQSNERLYRQVALTVLLCAGLFALLR